MNNRHVLPSFLCRDNPFWDFHFDIGSIKISDKVREPGSFKMTLVHDMINVIGTNDNELTHQLSRREYRRGILVNKEKRYIKDL